jgi:hypothetical protein
MLVDGEIDGTWLALLLCAYARLCVWELELILRPSSLSHCRIHVLRCSFSEYIKNLDFVRGHVDNPQKSKFPFRFLSRV